MAISGSGKTMPGLAAYEGDWWVYRFLVLVSRVMPVALRPSMPPNFQVLNPILLRILEKWIMEGKLGELFFGVSKLEYFRVTMKASPQTLFCGCF
jgi:hypothetical protein